MANILIVEKCKEMGITQTELAKRIGISKGALSGLIKNNNFTISTLERFSKALDCEIHDLIEREHPEDAGKIILKTKCPKCGEEIEVTLK